MIDEVNKNKLPNRTIVREVLLSVCLAGYLSLTIISLMPASEGKSRVLDLVGLWWNYWGLDQNWALFSPVIRSINYHTTAVLTFLDGTKLVWQVPRMDKLTLLDRFRYEKFRKWGVDSLPWPDYKSFWTDTAKFVGRKFYRQENMPVCFSLQLHWIEIPKPETNFVDRNALPEHTKTNTIFSYRYLKGDIP